ncbi:MAG: hypothetical protein HN535_05105 [Flavobacteriales bacterium]|nr:hypothetical protein [Flavobacteriales bacterium]
MMRLMIILLSIPFVMQGQNSIKCTTSEINKKYFEENPEAKKEREWLNKQSRLAELNKTAEFTSITIPIVFHVNDATNPQKVTLAQVQSAIDILNEDFNGLNSEFNNLRPEFQGIASSLEINFCLAAIDPDGNATNGITYHYNSYNGREPNGSGGAVKAVSVWPCDKYLNVWIVNEVEDDADLYYSGWAFYPSTSLADQGLDGIVYNHRYLGYGEGSSDVSGPTSWQAKMARVLTHEVGHYLNLMHTFANYCTSPGDEVSDTPPVYHHGSNNCDQNWTLCTGVTIVNDENYMDYTDCPSMFTDGQKTRALTALNSTVGYRSNLWSAANLIAVGCQSVTAIQPEIIKDKTLLKIIDILGRETKPTINTPLFYMYDDGTVEKKIIIE